MNYIIRSNDAKEIESTEDKLKQEQILDDPQFKIRTWHREYDRIHVNTNKTWIEMQQLFPRCIVSVDEVKKDA